MCYARQHLTAYQYTQSIDQSTPQLPAVQLQAHLLLKSGCNSQSHTMGKMHNKPIWAARYNTWLLIKATPKGVVFFFSFLFLFLTSQSVHRKEAAKDAAQEPILSSFLYASVLSHDSFEMALAAILANRLSDPTMMATELIDIFHR